MSAAVVELCGLPGSGKSTLAALVREALLDRGVPARIADAEISADVVKPLRVARRAGLALAESTGHPRRTASMGRLVQSIGQESMRDTAAGFVQWLAVQRLIVRARHDHGVHLIEEGPTQTLWTLALRASTNEGARLLDRVDAAPRPDLLVVVDVPHDVVLDRLGRRGSRHSRTQQLAQQAQRTELERGQVLLERLVRNADLPTVRIANDGSVALSAVARELAEVCQGLLAPTDGKVTPTRAEARSRGDELGPTGTASPAMPDA